MIAWGESLDYISNAWTKFLSVIQFKAGNDSSIQF